MFELSMSMLIDECGVVVVMVHSYLVIEVGSGERDKGRGKRKKGEGKREEGVSIYILLYLLTINVIAVRGTELRSTNSAG